MCFRSTLIITNIVFVILLFVSILTVVQYNNRLEAGKSAVNNYRHAAELYIDSNNKYEEAIQSYETSLSACMTENKHMKPYYILFKELQKENITTNDTTPSTEPCTIIKHTTSYKRQYNDCKNDLEECQTNNVGDCRSEERRRGKECRSRWSPYH